MNKITPFTVLFILMLRIPTVWAADLDEITISVEVPSNLPDFSAAIENRPRPFIIKLPLETGKSAYTPAQEHSNGIHNIADEAANAAQQAAEAAANVADIVENVGPGNVSDNVPEHVTPGMPEEVNPGGGNEITPGIPDHVTPGNPN